MWDVWIHILGIGAECACWRAGGRKGRSYGGIWAKNAGAQCAPLHRVYERLYIQEKGQVLDLSLKNKRRNAVSHKISLLTFFFKESKRPRFITGASYLCVL